MRVMNLPGLPTPPNSVNEGIKTYLERQRVGDARWPHVSVLLTAYLSWPNDEDRRNSFVATHLVRSSPFGEKIKDAAAEPQASVSLELFGGTRAIADVAFGRLKDEIAEIQRKWLLVADVMQLIIDMAFDERAVLRRGPSISKAIDLCECERGLPGHSRLRGAWSEFRDVAHLLAASAYLAHEAVARGSAADGASILSGIWLAPDAVLALAYGLQEFGLEPKPIQKESSILNPVGLWRLSESCKPEKPFIVYRRMSDAQLAYLNARRASKKITRAA